MPAPTDLEHHVAKAMYVDYRNMNGCINPDKAREQWDNGSAFSTPAGKEPWYRRARVAIRTIRERGLD